MINTLEGRDILRADQLSLEDMELILATAARYELVLRSGGVLSTMRSKVLATLFYEPSTRTRLSFESAMCRLGGQVVSVADASTSSSSAKGETLFDTGKMIEAYAEVAVIRHPVVGSAQELARGASVPVINAGDGAGQHPTQALLDVYTIRKEKGTIEGLTVAMVGDLKNGRTVHSLSALLALFGVRFYFVSPLSLRMPPGVTSSLLEREIDVVETDDLMAAIEKSDVVYMTRIQRERFGDPAEYDRLRGSYVLNAAMLGSVVRDQIVLHPLPRVDEIATDVDALPGAAYFRQAANGVPVRMALIALVTGAVREVPPLTEGEWAILASRPARVSNV